MIDKEYSQDKIFLHLDRLGEFAKGEDVAPIVIETNITNRCNANCVWCSEKDYKERHSGDQIDRQVMLSAIEDMGKMGVRGVVFEGGGEPTVHPDLLEFVKKANDVGVDCGLITNGMLLEESGVAANPDLFKFIRVSFDAGDPEVYARLHQVDPKYYEKIFSAVRKMTAKMVLNGLDTVVGMSFIVTEDNIETAREFARRAKDAGAHYVQFKAEIYENSFRIPFGAQEKVQAVQDELQDNEFRVFIVRLDGSACVSHKDYRFCYAHRFIGAITANGEVQLCCNLKHEHGDDYSFGNLNRQSFSDIWHGPVRKQLIDLVEQDDKFVQEVCGQCRMDSINRTFNWIRSYGGMKNFI